MARLKVESLRVTSFETTPDEADASVGIYTRNEPICYSPWCAPTFGTNCQTDGTA
ncbi:MAG TPA: hypothetical protein VFR81_13610 [Longimicrobium sp.]|nr:hypothetical protein [Longimicrobium sp.]